MHFLTHPSGAWQENSHTMTGAWDRSGHRAGLCYAARPMDVYDAIRHRRSVKPDKMKPDPLSPGLLDRMLEAARWAPTHGMTEPWRFIVFEGDARLALAEAVVATMARPGETIPEVDPRREKPFRTFGTPPCCIAIVCTPGPAPRIVEHEEIASTAIAVQNMQLVARAEGVATYWSSGEKAFHPAMAAFLDIAPPARCLGFLFVGWPAVPWPEATRRPIEEKVTWRGR